MKLIIAKPRPYARKARVALIEKAIEFETIVENPWLPDTEIGDVNPLGKIPTLSVRAIGKILKFRSRKTPTVASDFLHAYASTICAPARYASANSAPQS